MPEIREAIPSGNTQITGQFTADSARQLAGVLSAGALPVTLTFESSADAVLPPTQYFLAVRAVMIAAGAMLALLVAVTTWYLVWSRRQAALVTRYTS